MIWLDVSSFEIGKNLRQIKVWWRPYERYAWYCIAPTFKSGCTSVMVWGTFTSFDKFPLVIMPLDKITSNDFVTIVYKATLSGFYFLHDYHEQLKLMEDGAPVHYSSLTLQWRQTHGLAKLVWLANSPNLNPIENLWKIVKDLLRHHPRPKNKEKWHKPFNQHGIQYLWSNSKLWLELCLLECKQLFQQEVVALDGRYYIMILLNVWFSTFVMQISHIVRVDSFIFPTNFTVCELTNIWACKRFSKFVVSILIQLQAKNSNYFWTLMYIGPIFAFNKLVLGVPNIPRTPVAHNCSSVRHNKWRGLDINPDSSVTVGNPKPSLKHNSNETEDGDEEWVSMHKEWKAEIPNLSTSTTIFIIGMTKVYCIVDSIPPSCQWWKWWWWWRGWEFPPSILCASTPTLYHRLQFH